MKRSYLLGAVLVLTSLLLHRVPSLDKSLINLVLRLVPVHK